VKPSRRPQAPRRAALSDKVLCRFPAQSPHVGPCASAPTCNPKRGGLVPLSPPRAQVTTATQLDRRVEAAVGRLLLRCRVA
jgi:hypothetical protein